MGNIYYHTRLMAEIEKLILDSKAATKLEHPVLKGTVRESGIGRLILQFLPDGWDIGKGQIQDSFGNQSGEIDLIVYNKSILPPMLISEKEGIYPIESCIYAFEIKSKSTAEEIKSTILKFQKIMELKSLTKSLGQIRRVYFAYDTDLTNKSEFERYKEIDEKYYWGPAIPIISVLNKGYWIYSNESTDRQNFISRWLNFPSDGKYLELFGLLTGISSTIASENSKLRGMPGIGSYIILDDVNPVVADERKYKYDNPIS